MSEPWLRTMGSKAKATPPSITEANTAVTRLTSRLPAVASGYTAGAAMGIATVVYDHLRIRLSMSSGSDQAIGSARLTSPRIPLLCESAATKRPRPGIRVPRPRARVGPSMPREAPPTRGVRNPWYERSHARRYAAIVSAPSTLAVRSDRLLRVAQTASTKPIVTHGGVLAPRIIRGPAICLRNCGRHAGEEASENGSGQDAHLRDAVRCVAGRSTSFLVRGAILPHILPEQSGLSVDWPSGSCRHTPGF